METWSSYIDGLGREGCAADPAALLRSGLELELIRQPADMGRPFAVAVHRRGVLIGYLPKPDARPVSKLLDRGGRARAFVLALKHERLLTGTRLKSITIEIEAANPEDAPWSDADRAEIAALGIEAPLAPRRRNLAVPGRIAGALCAGVVAMAAWANMPELTPELEATENAAMVAVADPVDAVEPASKTQERPASAPAGVTATAAATEPLPLMANAALALPSSFTPFDGAGSSHIVVAVRNSDAPAAESPAATPVAAVPLPLPSPASAGVPMPLPRPEVRLSRKRR
ncbi:MAG: hypothetical protein K0R27_3549 [Xanthobacteraceae bacterium]|jgi:hypothetical protein|nr:hypothetical protein [Xanthobacteraceae bacterium]